MTDLVPPQYIALLLLTLFFAITFLQSAVDKVIDWQGNLQFITGHFKSSPLSQQVRPLLATLTFVEFLSGLLNIYAALRLFIAPSLEPMLWAFGVSGLNLLMLLFGQRLAKDYAGASTIGIYFILLMIGFSFL